MSFESYNYGSVNGDRYSEPLRPYTHAEEAGPCPQRSSGPGGEYDENRPLTHDVLGARQKRGAVYYFHQIFVACCLAMLVFELFRATKYADFSTTSAHPPPSYGSSKKQKHATAYDCMLEVSRFAFLVVNIVLENVEFMGGIGSSHLRCCCTFLYLKRLKKRNQSEEDYVISVVVLVVVNLSRYTSPIFIVILHE